MTATLTPPADAPLPWRLDDGLVAERDQLTVERDLARGEQAYWNRVAQENRAQYLTVADAIAPSSNNAHELADRVRAFRKRAEALEADRAELDRQLFAALARENEATAERDTALAQVAALTAALADAVNLAAEGISYTEPYFRTKREMVERLAAISAVAAANKETP